MPVTFDATYMKVLDESDRQKRDVDVFPREGKHECAQCLTHWRQESMMLKQTTAKYAQPTSHTKQATLLHVHWNAKAHAAPAVDS